MSTQFFGIQKESPVKFSCAGTWLAYVAGNHSVFILKRHDDGLYYYAKLINGPEKHVYCLSFHPKKDNLLAVAAGDGVFIVEVNEGEVELVINSKTFGRQAHEEEVNCVSWVYEGTTLISASKDGVMKFWDSTNDKYPLKETLNAHKSSIFALTFHEERNLLASAGMDSIIKIWDISKLKNPKSADDEKGSRSVLKSSLDGHRGEVCSLLFTKDGSSLLSGARDNTMKLWNVADASLVRELGDTSKGQQGLHHGDVKNIFLISNEDYFITSCRDDYIRLYKTGVIKSEASLLTELTLENLLEGTMDIESENGKSNDELVAKVLAHEDGIYDMDLNQIHHVFATTSTSTQLRLWDYSTGLQNPRIIQEFAGHSLAINDMSLLPDGNHLLTASTDNNLFVYDIPTGRREQYFNYGSSIFGCGCLQLPDRNDIIAAGGNDYCIKLYSINPQVYGQMINEANMNHFPIKPFMFELCILKGHTNKICDIKTCDDIIVSCSEDYSIKIWKVKNIVPPSYNRKQNEIPILESSNSIENHNGHVRSIAISDKISGVTYLASGGTDHQIITYKLNGTSYHTLERNKEAHTGVVSALTWGKGENSGFLYSGGWDNVIKVWNYQLHQLGVMEYHKSNVLSLEVSLDGKYLFSGSHDHIAVQWNASSPFTPLAQFNLSDSVDTCLCVKNSVLFGCKDGNISLWNYFNEDNEDQFVENPAIHHSNNSINLPLGGSKSNLNIGNLGIEEGKAVEDPQQPQQQPQSEPVEQPVQPQQQPQSEPVEQPVQQQQQQPPQQPIEEEEKPVVDQPPPTQE